MLEKFAKKNLLQSHYRHGTFQPVDTMGQKVQKLRGNLGKIQFSHKYLTCDAKRVPMTIFLGNYFQILRRKKTYKRTR